MNAALPSLNEVKSALERRLAYVKNELAFAEGRELNERERALVRDTELLALLAEPEIYGDFLMSARAEWEQHTMLPRMQQAAYEIRTTPASFDTDPLDTLYRLHDTVPVTAAYSRSQTADREKALNSALILWGSADDPLTRSLVASVRAAENDPTNEIAALKELKRHSERMAIIAKTDAFKASEKSTTERATISLRNNPTMTPFLDVVARAVEYGKATFTPTIEEYRALTSGADNSPTEFYGTLVKYLRGYAPMLQVSTVIDREDGRDVVIPRLTADASYGGTVVAEGGSLSLLDPTLSSVTLAPFKFGAITKVSYEMVRDGGFPVENEIARSLARELAYDVNSLLTTGDGSSKPNGVVTAATNGGTAQGTALGQSTDTFFSAYDLINLAYGLPGEYRRNARWMVNSNTLAKMRSMRDSAGGPIWNPGFGGEEGSFAGFPITVNDDLASPASATKSVLFGDFSRYFVLREVPSPRIDVSTEAYYGSDEIGVRVIVRVDGDLIDTAAVRYLVSANT